MAGDVWYADTSFWAGASFVVFVGGVIATKAHKKIGDMLDERVEAIKTHIDEAKTLREEAENLLGEYQRKQRDAEKEAAEMLEHAKADAKIMLDEAKSDIEEMTARRARVAQDKIAQAEASAVKEVQKVAVDAAISAATSVLGEKLQGRSGSAIISEAIDQVGDKLH